MKGFLRGVFALLFVAGLVCLGGGLWYLVLTVRRGNGLQDVAMIVDWVMSLGGTGVGFVLALVGGIGFHSLRSKPRVEPPGGADGTDEAAHHQGG